MKKFTRRELKKILNDHSAWLKNLNEGGRASLNNADLNNANLRYADLRYADLDNASLNNADLRYASLVGATFTDLDGLSYAPIQIANTKCFITIMPTYVLWGCRKLTFDEVKAFKFSDCKEKWDENEFKLNKKIITECIRYYRNSKGSK